MFPPELAKAAHHFAQAEEDGARLLTGLPLARREAAPPRLHLASAPLTELAVAYNPRSGQTPVHIGLELRLQSQEGAARRLAARALSGGSHGGDFTSRSNTVFTILPMEHQPREVADRVRLLITEHNVAAQAAAQMAQGEAAQHPAFATAGGRHVPHHGHSDAPCHESAGQPHYANGTPRPGPSPERAAWG